MVLTSYRLNSKSNPAPFIQFLKKTGPDLSTTDLLMIEHFFKDGGYKKVLFRVWILRNVVPLPLSSRPAREADRDERQAGGAPEGPGHLPGGQETGLPEVLLPVQRRPAGDPGAVAQPQCHAAPPQEVLWQHQEPAHRKGKGLKNTHTQLAQFFTWFEKNLISYLNYLLRWIFLAYFVFLYCGIHLVLRLKTLLSVSEQDCWSSPVSAWWIRSGLWY